MEYCHVVAFSRCHTIKEAISKSRLDKLLIENQQASPHKKVQAFINRLIKNKNSILTFLYHQNVPPDNNASERAIRNVKVK